MANHSPEKKVSKKAPLRLELKTPPPEMSQAISNVFGKLLGRPPAVERPAGADQSKPASASASTPEADTSAKMTAAVKMTTAAILSPPPASMTADAKMTAAVKMTTAVKMTEVIAVPYRKGDTSFPNYILDGLLPLLDPTASLVYLRLYRLSHGFQSETCTVGVSKLASSLNLGSRTVERAIAKLEAVGLVKRLSANFGKGVKGNTYLVRTPAVSDADTSVKMTEVVKMTGDAKMTTAVKMAAIKDDDDHEFKENHHQNARARAREDDDDLPKPVEASSNHEHLQFVKKLYEEMTGNTWKPSDQAAYEQIKHVPEDDIAEAMQRAFEHASNRPNTFKFFIREIQAVASPTRYTEQKKARERREREIDALVRVAKEVRARNVGRHAYSTADFVEDIKQAAAWKDIRYAPDLLDAALERLSKNRG